MKGLLSREAAPGGDLHWSLRASLKKYGAVDSGITRLFLSHAQPEESDEV